MVDVRVEGPSVERGEEILTPAALEFVADLQTRFGPRRDELLAARAARRAEIAAARRIDFRPDTAHVRTDGWHVPAPPPGLVDRRQPPVQLGVDLFAQPLHAHPSHFRAAPPPFIAVKHRALPR